jgi:hypothetical protein
MPNQETMTQAELNTESQDSSVTPNEQQTPEQTLDPRLEAIRNESEPDYSIPEKFKGKGLHDIARSYENLEKHVGKLGSEKARAEKELEEAKARAAQFERERQALYEQLQARSSVPHQEPQESDPFASFEQEVEKDPVEAIKGVGKKLIAEQEKTRRKIQMEISAKQAADYYQRQRKENPDFAALDQDMQQLAMQYSRFINPEVANTPETIDLLYSLAKAKNMNRYIDDAVKKAQTANDMVKAEKRNTYSESSTSTGQGRVNPDDLSLEELARLIGRK